MSIPTDCVSVGITAHLFFLGKFACEVFGKVYSLDDRPYPDVVTWIHSERAADGTIIDTEYECHFPLTHAEKAICEALEAEAKTPETLDRLAEAFGKHQYEASLSERGDRLRVVAAE
jgi:hypothetical protein